MIGMKQSLADFFAMGGYAQFIWPAYGIAALVLAGLLVVSLREVRQAREALRRHESQRGSKQS